MKISEKELRRIISEERDRLLSEQNDTLLEGRMAEQEAELIEDLVDMLIQRGAIRDPSVSMSGVRDSDDHYQEALDYIMQAVVPTLKDYASQGAYERK